MLAAAGIRVALFEEGRIAQRQAGRGTGIVVHEPEPFFYKLAKQHGVRDARHIYQSARRGSHEYLAALKRLRIECGLQIRDAVHFSTTPDGIQELQKEYAARRDAGLEVASIKGTPLFRRVGANGFGLVTHGNASVDPYKATLGFARAAVARGAQVFEQSRGHAHSPATADGRDQDRWRHRHRVEGRRGQRVSDRRFQTAAAPVRRAPTATSC